MGKTIGKFLRKNQNTIIFSIVLIFILWLLVKWDGWADWTGFNEATLVDWMQILVLPIMLPLIAGWFQRGEKIRALDNQQETAFQKYLDDMSGLLLDNRLLDTESESIVREFAKIRTGTIIRMVDKKRRELLIRFLRAADLKYILKGSVIDHIDLSNLDLSEFDFNHSNLRGVDLSNSSLSKTDLANANLTEANLSNTVLRETKLCNAQLIGVDLRNLDLRNINLSGANLSGAQLSGMDLRETILSNTIMVGADLSSAQLSGADLREANLVKANFKKADLNQADLFNADLSEADLTETDLIWANLRGANLKGAKLQRAYLHFADLSEAKMKDAHLPWKGRSGAYLYEMILIAVDLSRTYKRESKLGGVNYNHRTNWPEDFDQNKEFPPKSLNQEKSSYVPRWPKYYSKESKT